MKAAGSEEKKDALNVFRIGCVYYGEKMRRQLKCWSLVLVIAPMLATLMTSNLSAQRRWRNIGNRYYRPYYLPANRFNYYRLTRPRPYGVPSRPYFYYPSRHYPRNSLPYRGYYQEPIYPGYNVTYSGAWGVGNATYYLTSPNASFYPDTIPAADRVVRANYSHILFNVSPGTALIYLDDKLVGSARSFANEREKYEILEGEYLLRIEHPGYETFESVLQIQADKTIHLDLVLQKRNR